MNLIENLPDSRLETCLEVILQLTYVSCPIELKQKNVLKNKRLNCLRTNKISSFFLGTSKILSLGEFDESKTHLFLIHFSAMFLTILDIFLCQIMEYSSTLCFSRVN